MDWIPVNQELPENMQTVIATLKNQAVMELTFIGNKFKRIGSWGVDEVQECNPVVAWQPMPEPFMVYSLGYWDANDGKGYREHILTQKDFEDRGMCEYLGEGYIESEMDEYIDKFGEDLDLD